jgi:hypothetical protein
MLYARTCFKHEFDKRILPYLCSVDRSVARNVGALSPEGAEVGFERRTFRDFDRQASGSHVPWQLDDESNTEQLWLVSGGRVLGLQLRHVKSVRQCSRSHGCRRRRILAGIEEGWRHISQVVMGELVYDARGKCSNSFGPMGRSHIVCQARNTSPLTWTDRILFLLLGKSSDQVCAPGASIPGRRRPGPPQYSDDVVRP